MKDSRASRSSTARAILVLTGACACAVVAAPRHSAARRSPPFSGQSQSSAAGTSAATTLPRGKKLILKDGSFQLVREYKIEGDRIRYYSLDRSQWEEIPAALIDWDATKKEEAAESKRDAEVVAKAHAEEKERQIAPLDIDASLEVAPKVFLPPGKGLFVFDGKGVFRLSQIKTDSALSKRHVLEQVLVPIPIVPTRHTVSIPGAHAESRVEFSQPEFYMRVSDGSEPDVELVRAKVHGETRQIENLDELFKQRTTVRNTVPMERWRVAQGVYRYTVGKPLDPGEYAIIQTVQGAEMNLYVWDFGVDAGRAESAKRKEN